MGRHLAEVLVASGHQVVLLSRGQNPGSDRLGQLEGVTFAPAHLSDAPAMVRALEGCQAVYHCAGINREVGEQTFEAVHLDGTRNLLSALRQSGIRRIVSISFLQARERVESPYHVTKWQAEEQVRNSGLDYTIFKPGILYGPGDQFLTHLKKTINTFPFFGLVGLDPKPIAPIYIEDFVRVLKASLDRPETFAKTYTLVGPEALTLKEIVELTADTIDIIPNCIRLPIIAHRLAALAMEIFMETPLLTSSQITMLSEDLSQPLQPGDELPIEFHPRTRFLTKVKQE